MAGASSRCGLQARRAWTTPVHVVMGLTLCAWPPCDLEPVGLLASSPTQINHQPTMPARLGVIHVQCCRLGSGHSVMGVGKGSGVGLGDTSTPANPWVSMCTRV